jgi:hypothetical protein
MRLFTSVSGRQIDLAYPDRAKVDFADAAHHLAQLVRYGGAVNPPGYTVAQHLKFGTELCSKEAQPYFNVHDAHEYFFQDETTPKKNARPVVLAEELQDLFPLATIEKILERMRAADRRMENLAADAVHRAAGLQWPVPPRIHAEVEHFDRVMLLTEWREFMPGDPPEEYRTLHGERVEPLKRRIGMPWKFMQARDEYLAQCKRLLPVFKDQKNG